MNVHKKTISESSRNHVISASLKQLQKYLKNTKENVCVIQKKRQTRVILLTQKLVYYVLMASHRERDLMKIGWNTRKITHLLPRSGQENTSFF